ncbi:ubiquinone anaerobic biosynthesis accessory factor UbiT [Photobacterium galatheae]|uniref:ubiquinone anaerobic biosynthesis accessory factor UbiT n=1 Tax=Photobacterium galatheae TaxID=1654360 RepID=UPI0013773B96|nr:SCP2 sterol-binding domain-containing protein [Photobacterium galatheae]MCM0147750.1 SCP2 sterol-binding domain-containing protein [Photobacterium galatheae]
MYSPKFSLIHELAPRLLRLHCRLTPFFVHQTLIEQGLDKVFSEAIAEGELDFLAGRTVAIAVEDIDWQFTVTLVQERLAVQPAVAEPDAVMRAASRDLLRIAARQVDPDTLFFQRRLKMEGDTELGLAVKNLLDSLDMDSLPKPVVKVLDKAATVLAAE